MTRKQQRQGAAGENAALIALRSRGVLLVEKIGTPIRRIPHPKFKAYSRIIYGERVSGDHRGVLADGTSVLAEAKTINGGKLIFSDLREHQPEKLSAHALYAVSLLVWVSEFNVFVMRWPIPGFQRGKSLTIEQARALDLDEVKR